MKERRQIDSSYSCGGPKCSMRETAGKMIRWRRRWSRGGSVAPPLPQQRFSPTSFMLRNSSIRSRADVFAINGQASQSHHLSDTQVVVGKGKRRKQSGLLVLAQREMRKRRSPLM
jgi:hypothetical protein